MNLSFVQSFSLSLTCKAEGMDRSTWAARLHLDFAVIELQNPSSKSIGLLVTAYVHIFMVCPSTLPCWLPLVVSSSTSTYLDRVDLRPFIKLKRWCSRTKCWTGAAIVRHMDAGIAGLPSCRSITRYFERVVAIYASLPLTYPRPKCSFHRVRRSKSNACWEDTVTTHHAGVRLICDSPARNHLRSSGFSRFKRGERRDWTDSIH